MDISNLLANVANNHRRQLLESINSLSKESGKEGTNQFIDGEVVSGEVIDIKGLVANILTDKGQTLNGHLQNIGQLNIGDERTFIVKNEDGVAKFSIVSEDENVLYDQSLKKELKDQGFSANEKDINTAKTLIKNELPVNKETFANLSRALGLLAKDDKSLEKALYLMKNEIPVNSKNASMLDNFVNKNINMLSISEDIESGINNIKDDKLKGELLKIFNSEPENIEEGTVKEQVVKENLENQKGTNNNFIINKENENLVKDSNQNSSKGILEELNKGNKLEFQNEVNKLEREVKEFTKADNKNIDLPNADNIKDVFKFKPNSDKPREIDEFLNKTNEKIDKAIDLLKNSDYEASNKLLQTLTTHKESIDFMQFAKNNIYLQIPLNINDNKTNGELLVFKDKRKKNSNKQGVSAVIGLDTVNLGRYETYIHKNGNKVNFQFRLKDEAVINLTKQNFKQLEELLGQYNLVIESATYKTIEDSFTLITKEEDILSNDSVQDFLPSYKFNVKL